MSSIETETDAPATHMIAATQFIEVGSVRVAYRRFGGEGATPLVLLQHFRDNIDNWDPALTDALAREREVIDYPVVSLSSGAFGPTIADTARQMIAFVTALGLSEIDLLGFSISGFVAQEMTLIRPALVLASTGPKGGPGISQDVAADVNASLG